MPRRPADGTQPPSPLLATKMPEGGSMRIDL
nr:MAG TPA: hypothetical protein [Caudoviricetes sp.]